jgi:AcrR family transcriptional regulator
VARTIPADRLEKLVEAATGTFIEQGYRRTQMADVAGALGVAKGTLYGYVESKAALFDAAVRFADGHVPLPEAAGLPLRTPPPGATVRLLEERIAEEAEGLALLEATQIAECRDLDAELREILVDIYRRADRNRFTIKLVDRCSSEYPDLASAWFGRGRWAQHELLIQYMQARIEAGSMRPVPSVPIAARTVLETIAFWAVHRHWDPSPQTIDEGTVEDAVVDLLVHTLIPEG